MVFQKIVRKIELFKEKVKSLQEQLNEKEKYICDLETKLKVKICYYVIISVT